MKIFVNCFIGCTGSEGPGKRFALWVQGCDIRCPGCFNKEMWDKKAGEKYSVNKLFKLVKSEKEIEGITLLGGEPFGQAKALSRLARKINKAGLSVVTFTGYRYEELKIKERHTRALLKYTDLLLDGPFIEKEKDYSRAWIGSRNQRYLFLSERYLHLKDSIENSKNRIELRFKQDGSVLLSGMGDFESLISFINRE